jgi:acyl-CoA synthetase (AMP-forming)/AMP-acid ligase II
LSKILFPSLLANTQGKLSLVDATKSKAIVYASPLASVAEEIHKYRPEIEQIQAPELDVWFNEEISPVYPYTKSYEEAKNDPAVIFHTSGTTSGSWSIYIFPTALHSLLCCKLGIPKPVVYTNKGIAAMDTTFNLQSGAKLTIQCFAGKRIYCPLPIFHVSSWDGLHA